MELPLTVGVDGSDSGFEALDWAVDEAALHKSSLRVVYASRWERYETPAADQDRPAGQVVGHDVVGVAARRAERRNPDLKVDTEVLADDPVHALLQESRTSWALVTGSRGRGEIADLLLGSVSLSVAARAACPVIVVRGDEPGIHGTHDRILLGVADTVAGPEAVRFALREAATRDCELHAVRAWRCPAHETVDHPSLADGPCGYHQARADTLLDEALTGPLREHPSVRLRRALVEGPAHRVLVERTAAADLVVVGAQRHERHLGLQLGHVAHALLHHALCPVAVVPNVERRIRASRPRPSRRERPVRQAA
ncbi:universal stress protein [Streptomyces erythrochromogenes]|uniref:universal stress protein n=1 Tax=Streptomyces erythrochromogenes TaxID=285574 RepID=UPI00380FBFAD